MEFRTLELVNQKLCNNVLILDAFYFDWVFSLYTYFALYTVLTKVTLISMTNFNNLSKQVLVN